MRPALRLLCSSLFGVAMACCGCGGGGDLSDGAVPADVSAKSFPAGPGMPQGVPFDKMKAKVIADHKAKLAAKKGSAKSK